MGALGVESVPYGILAAADAVVLVLRPTVRFVSMAGPRIDALSRGALAGTHRFLLFVGEGPYPPREVSRALGGTPVLGTVPLLPKAARVLSDGAPVGMRWTSRLQMTSLLRAVGSLTADLLGRLPAAPLPGPAAPAAAAGEVSPPPSFGARPGLRPEPGSELGPGFAAGLGAGADAGGGRP
ncbi:hypothetical protein [Microbispora sp. H10949]|uniref:hypothetical protein n=1 Tax=Microbispora sp. H10949 TaxID=2729111 RepID=UPI0015FEFA35|nr:hypothetical protein [Microbispora sp. H10949]